MSGQMITVRTLSSAPSFYDGCVSREVEIGFCGFVLRGKVRCETGSAPLDAAWARGALLAALRESGWEVEDSEISNVQSLNEAQSPASRPETLPQEHAYNAYCGACRQSREPALSFGLWLELEARPSDFIPQPSAAPGTLAASREHNAELLRDYQEYREARGGFGDVALLLRDFIPVWERIRDDRMSPHGAQAALREAEAECLRPVTATPAIRRDGFPYYAKP